MPIRLAAPVAPRPPGRRSLFNSLKDRLAKHRPPAIVYLLILSGFLFFYGLNAGELYRTEGLRAIVASEFLRSGNWVVPMLYGEPLLTKPPGMYAAIALASWPCGEVREWTARLPSALAATATVLMFYWHFARRLGRRAGLTAAVILPLSVMWLDKGTSAEIDMLQVAWVTAAIVCFLRALDGEEVLSDREREGADDGVVRQQSTATVQSSSMIWFWWFSALLCMAGGVLTKWTAPVFFYGAAVPLLWRRRRLRLLVGRRHCISAILAASVCLAWTGAAASLVGWEVFYKTVRREALMRLVPAEIPLEPGLHHHRSYPWKEVLSHPFLIVASGAPASIFAFFTLWPGFARRWDKNGRRLLQELHCWSWPSLAFWSVVPEHAARHSFPLFPGLAGLGAMVWIAWMTGRLAWPWPRLQPARILKACLLLWIIAKMIFVEAVIPQRNRHRDARAKGEMLAALTPTKQPLYLFYLKDEGIMFYYGRRRDGGIGPPVRRVNQPSELPSSSEPLYCILRQVEWQQWPASRPCETIQRLNDEQGDPIVLVRVAPLPWAQLVGR